MYETSGEEDQLQQLMENTYASILDIFTKNNLTGTEAMTVLTVIMANLFIKMQIPIDIAVTCLNTIYWRQYGIYNR